MLEMKVIEPGDSDFTSPMILVEAPGKDPRPCINYRRLNKVTRTQFFPIPNIEQLIEKVSASKYISVLDLTRGYWQIPLSKQAQRTKERLSENPVLYCPDFSKPYIIQCDASNLGIGIVLSQVNEEGDEHPNHVLE
ncbi:hypothetical protein JTE90_006549 [Oedothorax gibbosus]|uniref:Reverse transcriptase/retrotransposon-derived protein RNase H-like domain-containing protein n=1 Tax=Oedothorax gibbosus TaxID=931172 RepID=A0AAV6VJ69_9ARAC|nr:hypothetical protein JTE90_006549 [Oedothorax gibbosus]